MHVSNPPTPSSRPEAPAEATLNLEKMTRSMKQGDEMAYREFHSLYYDRLWRYLLVVTAGDEDATGEALQAALLRVVRHIKVFTEEPTFWSWLTVLARTALSDLRRGRRRYLAFLDRFTRHRETEIAVASDTDATLLAALESSMADLSAQDRQLVEAKYICGLSVRQIAQDQQTTEKAIESRLSRVREKLKSALLAELKHET